MATGCRHLFYFPYRELDGKIGELEVVVEGNQIKSIKSVRSGEEVNPEQSIHTIDELFNHLLSSSFGFNDVVFIDFDTLGYPKLSKIYVQENLVGFKPWHYPIDDFTILSTSSDAGKTGI